MLWNIAFVVLGAIKFCASSGFGIINVHESYFLNSVYEGNIEATTYAISIYHVNPNKIFPENYGYSAMHYACNSGNLQMASLLVEMGARRRLEPISDKIPAPVFLAVRSKNISLIDFMLIGEDVKRLVFDQKDLLFHAIELGDESVVSYFVLKYAGNIVENHHIRAAAEQSIKMLDILSAHNRKLLNRSSGRNGLSPLHVAARKNNYEMINWLMETNPIVRVDKKDAQGFTALHHAAQCYSFEALWVLLIQRADINSQSDAPLLITPLHLAVEADFVKGVRALLEAGADRNIKDGRGKFPIDLALAKIRYVSPCIELLSDDT